MVLYFVNFIFPQVADNQDEGILYEASKCLISLGKTLFTFFLFFVGGIS